MRKGIRKHRKLVTAAVIVLVIAGAGAILLPRFLKKEDQPAAQAKQSTVQLSKMDLTKSVSATGTIESAKVKTVSASLSNIEIKSVKVKEGDTVKKGQTLVTFDETDLKETLADAKENLTDVKSQISSDLTSARRKVTEAQETYTSQKKQLAKNVKSAKSTYEAAKKAVSTAKNAEEKQKAEEALSQAKTAYEQAKSEQKTNNTQNRSSIQSAKDQLETTKSNSRKSLREAQTSVDDAEKALENAAVTAPMSGTVTAVGVESGDTYSGGDMIEISDCSNLQVNATITEYDIADIKKGQKVIILTDATGETEIQGKITYVALTTGSSLSSSGSSGNSEGGSSTSMSSSSSSSSGYEVHIKITDKNDTLRSGMTAKCSIILEEASDVYAVPYDAIQTDSSGNHVIYVKDSSGTKKEISVTKGMESDYYVEITGDDLEEGLSVIIPTDATSSSSSQKSDSDSSSGALDSFMGGGGKGNFGGNGGGGGGMPAGGGPGGR